MYGTIKERGRAASDHYAGTLEYFDLTPSTRALLQGLQPVLREHCRGSVLDAGAGRGAYKELLSEHCREYVGLDVAPTAAVALVGDVQRLPFGDGSFDTVFCSQVLEHVPDHLAAMRELARVLRPGGMLILTVPHISWLHNEPHDYFRFTPHGLRHLAALAGLRVVSIAPAGGLIALIGHIVSTLMINLTFGIPVLHGFARLVNALWVRLIVPVDRILEKKKLFALNYICIGTAGE